MSLYYDGQCFEKFTEKTSTDCRVKKYVFY